MIFYRPDPDGSTVVPTHDRTGERGAPAQRGQDHEERSAAVLTDRQREVLPAARERGYYDVPRTASLTDVADSLGIAKATASDTLHRAESHLVDWFVEERLGE